MKRITRLLAIAVCFLTLPYSAYAAKGVFKFRLPAEPATLDWNIAYTMIETYVLMNLMEGLVTFGRDMKVRPALAESWEISKDGRTYTFKIRKGVKWSDGKPLTASHFYHSWKRLLTPETGASYAYFLFDIVGAKEFNLGKLKDFNRVGIRLVDTQTFQIQLKRPIAHWIYIPTFWVTFPIRDDLIKKFGNRWTRPGNMQTVGPFTLKSFQTNSKVELKKNPNYYGKRGNIELAIGQIVQDDSTALNLFKSGGLDFMADISSLHLEMLRSDPQLKTFPYFKTAYLGFQVQKAPIDNRILRQAISHAIDRSKIGIILQGGQTAASTFVPPGILAHSKKIGRSFNVSKAKALLKKSGYGGEKIELVVPNIPKSLTMAQFIQQELNRNLGLRIELQTFDHKTFRSHVANGTYALFMGSWGADYPDPDNFLSILLSSAGNNRFKWNSPRFDKDVLLARGLRTPERRLEVYKRVQRLFLEKDAVMLPLYYEPNKALVKKRVRNLVLNPLNYLLLRGVMVE